MIQSMFRKKLNSAYTEILNALPYAAQIRTFENKILASNEAGVDLLGQGENPFLFLQKTSAKEDLKKLEMALWQHTQLDFEIPLNGTFWKIQLRLLKKSVLITAQKDPILQQNQMSENQIRLFQDIIQHVNFPLYLCDISGELIYINTSFADLIGHPFSDILGQNIMSFLEIPELKFIPFFESEATVSTVQGNCSFLVRQREVSAQKSSLFCGTLHPVMAPALTSPQTELPIPYLQINPENQAVLRANNTFLKTFKLKSCPQELQSIFSPKALETLLTHLQKNSKQEQQPIELDLNEENSYQVYVGDKTNSSEIDLYFIDITPHKNLENQMIQARKMQAIGQLTGGIAHDFNNILTAIMGFTDLLLQKHTAGDSSFADLMHIKGNVQKAAGLVGQLLTFSRKTPVQEHLISVHDTFVDLTSLLQRAIAPLCHLKVEYKRNLGFIKMDTNQFTQVFLNFAINAKDAMPQGGDLTINLTKEEVKKARVCGNDTMPAGSYLKVTIADSGSGITPEVLPHIFDPFFTTKKKSNQSGTGLGLSTVYGIIHSASGFIKVNSVPNVGTTFTVYLPRFEQRDTQIDSQPTEIQNVFLPEPKAPILLVDDEESIRTITARALQTKGFEVEQAASAEAALAILEKNKNFQLLITDMIMSGMDGEQLISSAKKLLPDLPCLLMSGYSESFEKHTSHKAKNFDFIAKPFVLADLLTKVKEILEKK